MFMHYLCSHLTLTIKVNCKEISHLCCRILAFLILAGSSVAMAGEHHKYIPGETRPGAYIFKNYCSVCHGDKGDGQSRARFGLNPPPRNFTTPESAIELTRERMIHSVTSGRSGTAMIAWKDELSAAEIEGVVDHIRASFMRLNNASATKKRIDQKLLASRGGALYMQACAMCHGDNGSRATSGRMQPPPTDFTLPAAAKELTRERMIASISHGRPGTAMISYESRFSKNEIEEIVDFIRMAFMNQKSPKASKATPVSGVSEPVVSDMSLPMPMGLKGDPTKGGDLFMKTCATCHGNNGDGNGPRAFFISPPPRNFLLESSRQRLNRPIIFEAITNGRVSTNMPAWGKVLSKQEIANVTEFVFQNYISASPNDKGQAVK